MAQKQQSHADAIRLYWTPERIRSAVPEDDEYGLSGKEDNIPPTVVSDDTRKTIPYQSVGKLVYKKGGKNYNATAYVVDTVAKTGKNNIVFTAAHNLYNGNGMAENIMFIPACQTDQKPVPEYGEFPQIPGGKDEAWIVATGWANPKEPWRRYLDMGAIKLARNKDLKNVGEVVAMLEYAVDCDYVAGQTKWRIIGYNTITNSNTKEDMMYQSDGAYVESQDGGKIIVRTNPVKDGMSGSPWLLKNGGGNFAIANGVHRGSSANFAVTPYFSTSLVVDNIIARL